MGFFKRLRRKGKGDEEQRELDKTGRIFLDHDGLATVRRLRQAGELDDAEAILLKAKPSAAVLDQLRLIASTRAREAKKRHDWAAVVRYLEGYTELARQRRDDCIRLVNQEPPRHTKTDQRLLDEARSNLEKQAG